jgi:tetratricopeptide (TPR) repeat protein
MLNGSGGQIDKLLEDSLQQGKALSLLLDIPYELNALPFELLNDGQFLAQRPHPRTFIIRTVTHRRSRQKRTAEKRPLKILFMACSPLELKASDVLSFEQEEELILSSVDQFAVDVTIEDSGCLRGLFETLFEEGPFDVVHISGHAGNDAQLGPVFYMEDDIGGLDKMTPQRLWDDGLKHVPPELLFLSGCSTGKADKVSGAESFAHQMVEKGVSRVLGWGLPVSDRGATRLTAEFYRFLGMGQSIVEAVNNSRQALHKYYHPWPLLRLFTDGSPLSPLIAAGQLRHWHVRKTTYKTLVDSRVRVLEPGFVGRRREIQQGVRVLKGVPDEQGMRRFGALIRGPAGIGKSCLAAKLIERFKAFKALELVVVHGRLTRPDILRQLQRLFDKRGVQPGVEVLRSDLEYEDKIKELFRSAFLELPVMIYLDDFEQNLVQRNGYWEVDSEVIPVLRPILQAMDWNEESGTRVVISSRYPFDLEYAGENLSGKLADITLLAFRDADLEKKTAELANIAASTHRGLYLEISGGNPRLLEWLEMIAKDEVNYDLESLRQALEGKSEEYIREYLSEILASTEGQAFNQFMQQAAVYRQPVEAPAYAALGDATQLERGVDLTLFEKEQAGGQQPVYWVMPVIREQQLGKLSAEAQKGLHKKAFSWYERQLEASEKPDYELLQEAVYHGLFCGQVRSACNYAIDLGEYLENLLLYQDKAVLQQAVADHITGSVLAEAEEEKDQNVSTLLNNLGSTYSDLGDEKKAIDYYQQALKIDLNVFGDNHPTVAIRYNNLGEAYRVLGDAKQAIDYYQQALEIFKSIYGDDHPSTQTVTRNMKYVLNEQSREE